MAAPNGAGPPVGGTASPAQAMAVAYGVLTGNSRQPATAWAHLLGGQRVMPKWWSLPTECLRGIAAPNGAGPPARGTGSPAQLVVAAYAGPTGDSSSQRRRPTGWGDAESRLDSGCGLWSACGG